MLKLVSVIFASIIASVAAQTVFQPGTNVPNVCVCGTAGQCAVAGGGAPTDGSDSGAFQARILNPGAAPTVSPMAMNMSCSPVSIGTPIVAESQDECAAGLDRCCPPTVGYTCGLRYPPVANAPTPSGSQVNYGDFAFQVALFTMNDVYLGSGALIGQSHALTAAHKVGNISASQIKVRIGDWNLFATTEPFPTFTVNATFTIHPNYTMANLKNNIAVITLAQPAPLGKFPTVSNICLPNSTVSNMRCFVSGWGRVDSTTTTQNVLSAVDVPLVDQATCQAQLRNTTLTKRFVLDRTSFVCAGGEAGKDACTGDGGAPLSCFIGDRYYLVGLAAWGVGCGLANVPGVYVNVQSYIPWIQSVIGKLQSSSAGSASGSKGANMATTTTKASAPASTAAAATTTMTRATGATSPPTVATTRANATTVKAAVTTTRASTVKAAVTTKATTKKA